MSEWEVVDTVEADGKTVEVAHGDGLVRMLVAVAVGGKPQQLARVVLDQAARDRLLEALMRADLAAAAEAGD